VFSDDEIYQAFTGRSLLSRLDPEASLFTFLQSIPCPGVLVLASVCLDLNDSDCDETTSSYDQELYTEDLPPGYYRLSDNVFSFHQTDVDPPFWNPVAPFPSFGRTVYVKLVPQKKS